MRERTTWSRQKIANQLIRVAEDPRAMNQDHIQQQPAADKYVIGDPSDFAEDLSNPGPGWKADLGSDGNTKRNEIGMPEIRKDTFGSPEKAPGVSPSRQASTEDVRAVHARAEVATEVARRMLSKNASERAIEDQALMLMSLPMENLQNTLARLAQDQGDDDGDDGDDSQQQQKQAQGQQDDGDDEDQGKQASSRKRAQQDDGDDEDQGKQASSRKRAQQDDGDDDKSQQKQAKDLPPEFLENIKKNKEKGEKDDDKKDEKKEASSRKRAQDQQDDGDDQGKQASRRVKAQDQDDDKGQDKEASRGKRAQQQDDEGDDQQKQAKSKSAQQQDDGQDKEASDQEEKKEADGEQQVGKEAYALIKQAASDLLAMPQSARASTFKVLLPSLARTAAYGMQQQQGQQQQVALDQVMAQVQQMVQQAMQQQMAQGQQQQPMGQQQLAPMADEALVDQMLQDPGPVAEGDIQMDAPDMDMGLGVYASGDEDPALTAIFASDPEVQRAMEASAITNGGARPHQARTASTRTVGTRPTAGVSTLGGASAGGSSGAEEISKLSSMWSSAPDVSSVFRS